MGFSLKIIGIANPVSGRRGKRDLLDDIQACAARRGVEFAWRWSSSAGDAARLAAQSDGADVIVVAGGDGTINDVVNGLKGRRMPLVVVPLGTENIIAKEFGFPATADAVIRRALEGRPLTIDAGSVNARRFMIVVGVGFDAEVVHRLAEVRKGHISHATYLGPLLTTFARHEFPRLVVEVDGVRVFEARGLALVGNLSRYSMGLRILNRASPEDGLLDVCALPCDSRGRLLLHALDIARGRHTERTREGVVYAQGACIRIDSPDAAPVEVDGEPAGVLPIECRVCPRDVRLLVEERDSAVLARRNGREDCVPC